MVLETASVFVAYRSRIDETAHLFFVHIPCIFAVWAVYT